MRILHCCLACFYIDNQNYQENLLPKMHLRMGHDVMILASTESFASNGEYTYVEPRRYVNEDGIPVVRVPYVKSIPKAIVHKLRKYKGVMEILNEYGPELIFIHDIQFLDIRVIRDYAKTHNTRIVADCHTDFANSGRNFLSKYILHGVIYKRCAQLIEPYTDTFFGVLPARVDFLKEVYKLPARKCKLLVMGVDDEVVDEINKNNTRDRIRRELGVVETDFLVVTGGKINQFRPETLNLMKAIATINDSKIKLVIFGLVSEELKDEFNELLRHSAISYIGWKESAETYNYLSAADLVVFPGLHSVMWEQAVGLGIPCIFRKINGFNHVDIGGNAILLEDVSAESLSKEIIRLVNETEEYEKMKKQAKEQGIKVFSYRTIAQECIKK